MTNAPATPTSAPLLFGRYRILEQLGEGRLAIVYGATDERLQRRVLIHLMRKDLVGQEKLRERFVAEANASAQRSHPALLEVFDSGEVSDRPFMVTEYAVGRPLRSLGVLTTEQALLYIRQIAGAVTLCQARNLPHPPISSSNVLLIDEGRVKLVESWLTPPGEVLMDLAYYRAPERTEGQPPGPANAVYSLGLLLYEMLTGARPISGNDPQSVAQAHLTTRIPPLSQIRPMLYLPALERVLAQATARTPQQRLASAAALSAALDEFWRELGTSTRRLAPTPVAPKQRREVTQPDPRPAPQPIPTAAPPIAPANPIGLSDFDNDRLQPLDRDALRQKTLKRGVVGWLVILLLLVGVAFGSYLAASVVVDRLFAIQLPRPSLPSLGIDLPSWVPGAEQGETLVVNTTDLNMRERPGTAASVIRAFPSGTRVRKLEGPVTVDNISWVRVRIEFEGKTFEGWMSENFLKPAE